MSLSACSTSSYGIDEQKDQEVRLVQAPFIHMRRVRYGNETAEFLNIRPPILPAEISFNCLNCLISVHSVDQCDPICEGVN